MTLRTPAPGNREAFWVGFERRGVLLRCVADCLVVGSAIPVSLRGSRIGHLSDCCDAQPLPDWGPQG